MAIWCGILATALLLWVAGGLPASEPLARLGTQLQGPVTIFLGIFIEALPFLLAGVLASSAIRLFVSSAQVRRLSPRSPIFAALAGSLLGLAFPVCECGSVPTARRLLAKGAPLPLGIAFVLAAPAVNPVVIASTWVAFGGRPEIVIGRVVLTVLIAAAVGLALGAGPRPHELLAPADQPHDDAHDHDHDHSGAGRLRAILEHASEEFFEMGRYLVLGALIAATLQTVIPRSTLLALGQGPVVSAIALMALAVVLSICSTVDAFVALAFASSFLPGALLAFLVFGPMVDIKSVLMFSTTFRRRTVALMVLLTFQMTLLAAVIINLYLR
ncbi:MAG TPA: permease [Roseiflexaceae bacterium]